MNQPAIAAFLFVEALPVSALLVWLLSGRVDSLKATVRSSYRTPVRGLFASRLWFVCAPLWAPPVVLLGLAVLLVSRPVLLWILALGLLWAAVALPLAYRVPPPAIPRWFAEELADGRTPVQRKDRWDRGCLWLMVVIGGSLGIGLIFALVVYRDAAFT